MTDQKQIITGLQEAAAYFRSSFDAMCGTVACEKFRSWTDAIEQAIALLKAQEPATVEPKRIELADETKAWLDEMDAVDALGNIADICIDWDGYRTADGLGGLINEIWAYARYCADRIAKAQEPRVMKVGDVRTWVNSDRVMREPIVIEIRGGVCAWIIDDEVRELPGEADLSSDLYDKTWRCWTSRPTDEQREAIPWQA